MFNSPLYGRSSFMFILIRTLWIQLCGNSQMMGDIRPSRHTRYTPPPHQLWLSAGYDLGSTSWFEDMFPADCCNEFPQRSSSTFMLLFCYRNNGNTTTVLSSKETTPRCSCSAAAAANMQSSGVFASPIAFRDDAYVRLAHLAAG